MKQTPVNFALYVEDADASFKQAVDAGATVIRPIADQFHGDRAGCVQDPFGHKWTLMTHKEDLSPEELNTRLEAEYAKWSQAKKWGQDRGTRTACPGKFLAKRALTLCAGTTNFLATV